MARSRFARFAWANVAFNLLVILWGAYVRASGSGAGCGDHWPLCDGQVIPRALAAEQLIEFTHRLTSGLALIGVVVMVIWAFCSYERGHIVRRGAAVSLAFMVVEALVGAGLVLLGLVATNVSVARALVIAFHLANTFFLLAALTLTAWWASGGRPLILRGQGRLPLLLGLGLAGTLVVGSSGAITALGDTLLQLGALPGGVSQPITTASHPLVQMRVLHPVLGTLVGLFTLFLARAVTAQRPEPQARRLAWGLVALFFAQILLGGLNVTLKAPIWMQLVHLLMADLVWICLVLLGAVALAAAAERTQPAPATVRPGTALSGEA
jgi:cytochrome c oxidase assembly protein subunit 15